MARKRQEQHEEQQTQEPHKIIINDTLDTPEQAAATSTAEKIESLQNTIAAKQEELQNLMQLPLSQIEALPQEQQEAVFAEMGRQIVEIPGLLENIKAIAEEQKKIAKSYTEKVKPFANELAEAFSAWADRFNATVERAQTTITNLLSSDTMQALQLWVTLEPYIKAEADENESLYTDPETPATVLIEAAARRARADGKEIPTLKFEEPAQTEPINQPEENTETNKEETPADIIEKIKKMPRMPTIRPRAYNQPNLPLLYAMQHGLMNGGGQNLPVLNKGKTNEITTYILVNSPDTKQMTEYERSISNAVFSLWEEAKKLGIIPAFDTDAIYGAMPGGGEMASQQQKDEIRKAIEKYRRVFPQIDATDEFRARGIIGEEETFKFDEPYFQMIVGERTSKRSGQKDYFYFLTSEPLILKYAKMTKQIISVPAKHLNISKIDNSGKITPELISMNADRQAITNYMMRRIAVMKHDLEEARESLRKYENRRKKHPEQELPQKPLADFRQQSSTILFDTLFAETDTVTDNRTQAKRNREFCFDVLDYWKATAFIRGYSMQSKGRKITGIVIEI